MPVEGPLPQTGYQQDIGADADRCFRARIPRDWRPHGVEGTDDYGIDYQIQTVPGQRATDIFRAQLKGTRTPDVSSDGKFISIQLKASTVRFYDRFVEPILLVVCDLSADPDPVDCPLYYAWVRDELRRVSISTLDPAQKYVTLRVSTGNRLRLSTDLSAEIDAQNELARAGHALGVGVERSHPGMQVEERVGMVRQIAVGVSSRSAAFMDALAAAPAQHWVEPAAGTLAWRLREAERLLRLTSLDRAASELDAAEAMLADGTALEIGDCRFLRGKWHTARGADDAASESFRTAYESNPMGKYVAARVEAELRRQYAQDGPKSYPELLALLDGDDPFVLSSKSRVLAAEGRLDDAIKAADQIEGPERHAARAIAHTVGAD